jgi:hypothetical protein
MIKKCICLIVASLLILSCSNEGEEIKDTSEITNKLLTAIKEESFVEVPIYYDSEFYSNISKDEWNEDLRKINKMWNGIESFKLENFTIENKISGGKYFVLAYKVKYNKRATIQTFTLIKEGNSYKVRGHHIKEIVND